MGYVDQAPVSNADIGKTLAHVLHLKITDMGKLVGRVIEESLPGGNAPAVTARAMRSKPAHVGLETVLMTQTVGSSVYFDAAGFPGRTVRLEERNKAASR